MFPFRRFNGRLVNYAALLSSGKRDPTASRGLASFRDAGRAARTTEVGRFLPVPFMSGKFGSDWLRTWENTWERFDTP